MNLSRLVEELQKDQNYHHLEALEKELKLLFLQLCDKGDIKTVVHSSHSLGLLVKYKPYGIKCCTLLGYSIFLLNKNEGFSFQQHTSFKTELFHFIEVYPCGYVFIAENDQIKNASRDSLASWFHGQGRDYDAFKYQPEPGDVYKVNRTGIAHTVIGCAVEEYANTSTDMVERLYDQNKGRDARFEKRKAVLERIRVLQIPLPKQEYVLQNGRMHSSTPGVVVLADGVKEYKMHDDENFSASRIHCEAKTIFRMDTGQFFFSLFCSGGKIELKNSNGYMKISLFQTESVILPPATSFLIHSDSMSELSVLKITKEKAFL